MTHHSYCNIYCQKTGSYVDDAFVSWHSFEHLHTVLQNIIKTPHFRYELVYFDPRVSCDAIPLNVASFEDLLDCKNPKTIYINVFINKYLNCDDESTSGDHVPVNS